MRLDRRHDLIQYVVKMKKKTEKLNRIQWQLVKTETG